ncbi:hypothetical protein T11_12285 [Trichinella zimbabwensis]|uniref:Uncharacterized protein n=1 Tax=Trichinella zimbabwensis TaxID=268475 RepID=A0A0V1IB48_9BILA|nr:hypothetical protein T11_12285 [Trichinella zimbabwensis]
MSYIGVNPLLKRTYLERLVDLDFTWYTTNVVYPEITADVGELPQRDMPLEALTAKTTDRNSNLEGVLDVEIRT